MNRLSATRRDRSVVRGLGRKGRGLRLSRFTWDVEGLENRLLLSFTPTPITRYHVDNQSSGVNSTETLLTPSTVNVNQFGKQFSTPVDGQVYAEPLYVPNLNITGGSLQGIHSVVFVATEHDTLYAIDAHGGNVLWSRSFLDSGNGAVNVLGASSIIPVQSPTNTGSNDLNPEIGITATPVIDLATNSLYLVAKSQQTIAGNSNHFVQVLYRVNIQNGAVTGSKVIGDTINSGGAYTYVTSGAAADTPYCVGSGNGSITVNGQKRVYFNAQREFGRSALLLNNGTIYMGFASHGDNGPYHGWMLAFDAASMGIKGALNTTPNGGLGGIWQGGSGIVVDPQGYFYFETGNGSFNTSSSNFGSNYSGLPKDSNYGDCFVKVGLDPTTSPTNQNANGWGLKVVDFFSPFNNSSLNSADTDLGSGGPTILPDAVGSTAHPHLLIGAGKEGKLYLIDRDNMGGFNPSTDHVVQEQGSAISGQLNSAAFFLNNPNPAAPAKPSGSLLIVMGYGGGAKAFNVSNGAFSTSPTSTTSTDFGYLPGSPTISADGTSNSILWAINRNTNKLYAYRADNLGTELWDSGQAPNGRDLLGTAVKFSVPTVADGQVFVGTSNALVVYGPPVAPTAPPAAPGSLTAHAPFFNEVVLDWADLSSNEDEFLIERTTTPNDPASWQQIDTTSANATEYVDTSALAETTYSYRIRSFNSYQGGSYSTYSNTVTVTTPKAPPIGAGDGVYGQYYNDSGGQHLSGTPVLTRVDPQIDFDWGTGSPGGSVGSDHFSVKWTGRIQAQFSETYTFYATRDDGIRLLIKPAGAANFTTLIDQFNDHSPVEESATYAMSGGALYDFELDYYENGGGAVAQLRWSSPSTVKDFIPQSQLYSGVAPAAPTSLAGVAASGTQVNLTWQDNSDIETGYVVERKDPGGSYVQIASLAPNTTSYMDALLSPDTQYTYRVKATNFMADSGYTNVFTVTTPIPPAKPTNAHPTTVTTTSIDMAWNDVADNEDGYRISRAAGGEDNFIVIAQLPANSHGYLDLGPNGTGLTPGVEYEYHIQAYNVAGYNDFSGFRTATVTLAPTDLATSVGDGTATLTWTPPSFTGSATTMSFNVYRSSNSDGSGATLVASELIDPTFTDTGLNNGQTYYYTVTAVDAGGESQASNIASATPIGGLVIQGNGNGTITIRSDGTNTLAWVDHDPQTDPADYSVATASLNTLAIDSPIGSEKVIIDYSGGADPLPAGGLSIGGAGGNTLELVGRGADDGFALSGTSLSLGSFAPIDLGGGVSSIQINGNGGSDSFSVSGATATISADLGAGGTAMALSVGSASALNFTTSQQLASLSVLDSSSVSLSPGHDKLLSTGMLQLDPGASLDLADNDLLVSYQGDSPEATLQQYVKDALASANAHGLFASLAHDPSFSQSLRALAVFDNHDAHFGSFDGQTLGDYNQVLVKYTYLGDANGDGKVDPTDYAVVDGKIGLGHSWITGDLNFDGKVDPSDYAQIDGNQGAGQGGDGGPQLALLPLSAVAPAKASAAKLPSSAAAPQPQQPARAAVALAPAPASPFSKTPISDDSDLLGSADPSVI